MHAKYETLNSISGNHEIDDMFLDFLKSKDQDLMSILSYHRLTCLEFSSDNILLLAIHLENFLLDFFSINEIYVKSINEYLKNSIVFDIRQSFIQRYVLRNFNINNISSDRIKNIHDYYGVNKFTDYHFSNLVSETMHEPLNNNVNDLAEYAAWSIFSTEGRLLYADSFLFNLPKKILPNYTHKTSLTIKDYKVEEDKYNFNIEDTGFKSFRLNKNNINIKTDFLNATKPIEQTKIIGEAKYCLHCHKRKKDSCSHGFIDAEYNVTQDSESKKISGCPLRQKISEMNLLLTQGRVIAALAVSMIDNPMIIVTGNRICNDCSMACIFQKQDQVDIPSIESGMLELIFNLPYGFEIYAILTRWNPLKQIDFLPKYANGKRVFIAGLGPAGFSMAYFLLHLGYTVVAVDGLIMRCDKDNDKRKMIRDYNIEIMYEKYNSDDFGGIMAYGITSRWNKMYLRAVKLILERHELFRIASGICWGGSLNEDDVFANEFDGLALALGCASANVANIKNIMTPGVILASDFLMTLHLHKMRNSDFANDILLQWPVAVIGGGLTAVDVATEITPYYINQLKDVSISKKDSIINSRNYQTWLNHNDLIKNSQDVVHTIQNVLGTVKIVSRNNMHASKAYLTNKKEVVQALKSGVEWVEDFIVKDILFDKNGFIYGIIANDGREIFARTIILATGTGSNTLYCNKSKLITIKNDNIKLSDDTIMSIDSIKPVAILGDMNVHYSGSVVKAIASSKLAARLMDKKIKLNCSSRNFLTEKIFLSKIIINLLPVIVNIVDDINGKTITIRAFIFAKKAVIGHIFRMKITSHGSVKTIPVTAIKIDRILGLITVFVFTGNDVMRNLIKELSINQIINFMGPLGLSPNINHGKGILIITNERGLQYAKSIAKTLTNNMQIICISEDRSKMFNYCSLSKKDIVRKIFRDFILDIVHQIELYNINYKTCLFLGSVEFVKCIYMQIKNLPHLNKAQFIYQVETYMRCMLGGVCGKCIIKINDKGEERYVFACREQEIDCKNIDFEFLSNRVNSLK